jgi:hypothetical protein
MNVEIVCKLSVGFVCGGRDLVMVSTREYGVELKTKLNHDLLNNTHKKGDLDLYPQGMTTCWLCDLHVFSSEKHNLNRSQQLPI